MNTLLSYAQNIAKSLIIFAVAFGFSVMPFGQGLTAQIAEASSHVVVDSSGDEYSSLQNAIDDDTNTPDGDTITLVSDITLTEQTTIDRELTIDGDGYTIYTDFEKTSTSNNSAIGVQADDVTIKNLTVADIYGAEWPDQLHGINVYTSTGVTLTNITATDFGGSGILVNGSTVAASDITTAGNAWHGINVDQGSSVTQPAVLNISNTSSHDENSPATSSDFVDGESIPDIFIDDVNADATVNDLDSQYISFEVDFRGGTAKIFTLKETDGHGPDECAGPDLSSAGGDVENTDTSEQFDTIQDAIDDCDTDNGDTIEVGAGTYEESVTIDKPNLTLESVNGATSTEISADATEGVMITETGVTVRGFTITTNLDDTGTHGQYGIRLEASDAVSDILIEDNVIEDISDTYRPTGISLDMKGTDDKTATDVTVRNNTIRNITGADSGYDVVAKGINPNERFDNLIIKNNTIHNIGGEHTVGATGIDFSSDTGVDPNVGPWNFTIEGNDIDGITVGGTSTAVWKDELAVYFHAYGDLGDHSVTKNNFHDGDVLYNTAGVTDPDTLNAEENWWGDSDGPSGDDGEGNTDGVEVRDGDVDYSPWLCNEYDGEDNPLTTTDGENCFDLDDDENEKVAVCHMPPGNPDNAHTIYVSENAVKAHQNHGDELGECELEEGDREEVAGASDNGKKKGKNKNKGNNMKRR